MKHSIPALLVVITLLGSGPALAVAGAASSSDTAATDGVIVYDAQAATLQLENATVENVTIEVLRIDSLTIQNQTEGDLFGVQEGQETGPVVLRGVQFQNLSLDNASAEGVSVAGQSAGAGPPAQAGNQTQNGVPAVGNVSDAVVGEMNVEELVVQQANVSESGGNGVIGGIIDRISGLFGGDGQQADTETTAQPDLRIGTVDVTRLSVDQLTVEQVEELQQDTQTATPANETQTPTGNETAMGADGAANQTVLGQVTAENATIGTVAADAMVVQQAEQVGTQTETPAGEEPTPSPEAGANETTP